MIGSDLLICQAIEGKRPCRVPIFDVLQNDAVIEHFSGLRLDSANDAEAMIRAASSALDGTRHIAPPFPDGHTWTDEIGNSYQGARWTFWIKTHAFQTADQWKIWLPGHLEELEARPFPSPEQKVKEMQRQRSLNARLGGTLFIHSTPSTAINYILFGYRCGLDVLPFLLVDERELTLRWFRAQMRETLRYLELSVHRETSPLVMIYSDVAYHEKLMFSPRMMKDFYFFDDVAAICDLCHKKGVAVIFHSDGYIMEILADLVEAGIDGLNPLEKAAGMDIRDVRRRHPDLLLVGGVDVSRLMPFGSTGEIRRETRNLIDDVGAEGRFLIGSTTEIGDDIPLANYLAFHDEVMKG